VWNIAGNELRGEFIQPAAVPWAQESASDFPLSDCILAD